MASARLIGVGAFVLGGLVLFAAGLFLIGDRRGLFRENFEVYAEFSKLAGLENGATVRVAGLDAGQVTAIHVPTSPGARFRVRVRIREDLHGVVRTDSIASIQNEGLVGNKFVQIEGGTDRAPRAPNGSTIGSRDPFDIADLMQQMNVTLGLVSDTIEMLRVDVRDAVQTITRAAGEAGTMIADARGDFNAIAADARRVAADMRVVIDEISAGRGTIGRLLKDDALYRDARAIAAQAEQVVANLRHVAEEARRVVTDVNAKLNRKDGPAQGIAADLRETLAHARDAMSDLAENAEALKRNFFFRGYFNRRGYFDLDDLSPEEYRKGGLEGADRRALRLWIDAAYLFRTDAAGVEQLTEEGMARVDSAMSQFLSEPSNAPLVIEGYADGPTAEARYRLSRRRASLVREYVIRKYTLDANRVGQVALGHEASGSPAGDRWQGVALALFVPR